MKDKDLKLYFEEEEGVDIDIFEIEENEHVQKRMAIEDFKDLARRNGLLEEHEEEKDEKEPDREDMIACSFEVVEE